MRRLQQLLIGFAVVGLFSLACAPTPAPGGAQQAQAEKPTVPPAKERRLTLGCVSPTTAYGIYCAALVTMLNRQVPGTNVTYADHGGIVNNLKRLQAKEVDFIQGDQFIAYKAYGGDLKGWENSPQREVRLLWAYDPIAIPYIVHEAAGVRTFADLDGKPFSPGGQGTNAEVMTTEIFPFLGIKAQYYRGSVPEVLQAFKDRRIVGFPKATPLERPDPVILEAMVSQPLRILSWPNDLVAKVGAKFPSYKTFQIPAGVYKTEWNKEPIVTWGTSAAVMADTGFPEDLAYQFTKAAITDKTEQVAAFPALKGADIGKRSVDLGLVPLHKGAIRALREVGHQVPKELVPSEAQ